MSLFARIKIGKSDEFITGDGLLQSVSFTLAEGANNSNCTFVIADLTKKYTEKYFTYIYDNGGLEPLVRPDSASTSPTGQTGTSAVNASANMKAFLDMISLAEGTNTYPNSGYNTIFTGAQFDGFGDHPRRVISGSSAAGRYQILAPTYDGFRNLGVASDFTPESQDKIAIALIEERGHTDLVESGNVAGALNALDNVWTSFQVKPHSELIAFFNERVAFYSQGGQAQQQATDSIQGVGVFGKTPISKSESGQQITIEVGISGEVYAAFSFIHQGLDFALFDYPTLTFKGQASTWVLTQRVKNTAYTNLTLSQIAKRIVESYGMNLSYKTNIDPKYDYFPQRGQTDYDALLIECRRLGLRLQTKGNTLQIYDRRSRASDQGEYVIVYGENLGLNFTASHQAQTDGGSGDARSLDVASRTPTGQRKIELDPELGQLVQTQLDSQVGMGSEPTQVVSGSDNVQSTPIVQSNTDSNASTNVQNENRIRGVKATINELPTTADLWLITPDDVLSTKEICTPLDRVWVIESVTHEFNVQSGWKTSFSLYSPMKSRFPPPAETASTPGVVPASNPGGFINPCPAGVFTSGFRTARRPNHQGVDIGAPTGTPIYAAQDGLVSRVANDPGGYGPWVELTHDGGFTTRYGHMSQTLVTQGQTVTQGQEIAKVGSLGRSTGPHLHWEIRLGGSPQNPEDYVQLPR